MRGDYLSRQWRIIKAVAQASHGLTAAKLAEQEEVELRTVYRDLQTLQEAGFPLYGKKEGRTTKWYLMDPVKGKGVPAPFTMAELIALWLAKNMLARMPDASISHMLESLLSKFAATLAQGSLTKLNEIQESFAVVGLTQEAVDELTKKIDLVNQMVLAKKRLRIIYEEDWAKEPINLLTDPYRTWYYENQWYLMAYCHEYKQTRMLLIENIKQMRLIDEDSTPDPNFDLGDFLRQVCGQVMSDKLKVRIKVAPVWQQWFSSDKKNNPPLAGHLNSDGSLEVEISLGRSLAARATPVEETAV